MPRRAVFSLSVFIGCLPAKALRDPQTRNATGSAEKDFEKRFQKAIDFGCRSAIIKYVSRRELAGTVSLLYKVIFAL